MILSIEMEGGGVEVKEGEWPYGCLECHRKGSSQRVRSRLFC